ncbi:hypothetical protein D046_5616B, partial [Vibrio parahaemolyticus V-223/04]
QMATLSLRWS